MKISTILDHIDGGHMALPEFQRGYVWNREQVRGLFDSLYKRHPVGGLLVWATQSGSAAHRGDGALASGVVKLLLDGQQRMTSLYGVLQGRAPRFFDGDARAFTGLRFHLDQERFAFYQPVAMENDPMWVDVTALMSSGQAGLGAVLADLSRHDATKDRVGDWAGRLSRLLAITDIDLYVEEVSGADKTLDVVVDIFNRVNSGGTKLSKGDLALAKICADWPDARDTMRAQLGTWAAAGYDFDLDWLLRSVNTVLTGEAKFSHLHDQDAEAIQGGLKRAVRAADDALNLIAGRLGLDHARVLFGRLAIPVMARFLDQAHGPIDAATRDKLLFWYAQAGMWGRFSGSTESVIDQDLAALDQPGGLDALIEQLSLWQGGLRVEAAHFTGWSRGARFYPVLYMLTRTGMARDWGSGLPLKANMLGKMSKLEVHHVFPKARLYAAGYKRPEVNALANFCFLTKDTNLVISDTDPAVYFPRVEAAHPGALASQWIPMDEDLWSIDRFGDFLEARKALLADAVNALMTDLLGGDAALLDRPAPPRPEVPGGIASDEEERALRALREAASDRGCAPGVLGYELADAGGTPIAVLDLAWPDGLQPGLTQPVAVLLGEEPAVAAAASRQGYRCFQSEAAFERFLDEAYAVAA